MPLFTMLGDFTEHEAIPLSIATVFGASMFSTLGSYVWQRHPLVPHRPMIAYDATIVLLPATLLGSTAGARTAIARCHCLRQAGFHAAQRCGCCGPWPRSHSSPSHSQAQVACGMRICVRVRARAPGVFLNKVCPNWMIVVLLVALCAFSGKRTLDKAFKQRTKEATQHGTYKSLPQTEVPRASARANRGARTVAWRANRGVLPLPSRSTALQALLRYTPLPHPALCPAVEAYAIEPDEASTAHGVRPTRLLLTRAPAVG